MHWPLLWSYWDVYGRRWPPPIHSCGVYSCIEGNCFPQLDIVTRGAFKNDVPSLFALTSDAPWLRIAFNPTLSPQCQYQSSYLVSHWLSKKKILTPFARSFYDLSFFTNFDALGCFSCIIVEACLRNVSAYIATISTSPLGRTLHSRFYHGLLVGYCAMITAKNYKM